MALTSYFFFVLPEDPFDDPFDELLDGYTHTHFFSLSDHFACMLEGQLKFAGLGGCFFPQAVSEPTARTTTMIIVMAQDLRHPDWLRWMMGWVGRHVASTVAVATPSLASGSSPNASGFARLGDTVGTDCLLVNG